MHKWERRAQLPLTGWQAYAFQRRNVGSGSICAELCAANIALSQTWQLTFVVLSASHTYGATPDSQLKQQTKFSESIL
jgi:hypothetical protein